MSLPSLDSLPFPSSTGSCEMPWVFIWRMAASTLLRADCALGAFARRMRARLGAPKAITATARKLAIIIYNMLKYGKAYVDRGEEYYQEQYRATMVKNLKRRAKQLGFEVVEMAAQPVAPEITPRA